MVSINPLWFDKLTTSGFCSFALRKRWTKGLSKKAEPPPRFFAEFVPRRPGD